MVIRKKQTGGKLVLDLTGPQGNAYVLLGYAMDLAEQLDLDWKQISEEMKSSDYENLVETFDRYFGDLVILER